MLNHLGRSSISNTNKLAIKVVASIALAELCIVLAFRALAVESWLPSLLIDLANALLIGVIASIVILFWVVKPMKNVEKRATALESTRLFRNLIDRSSDVFFVVEPVTGRLLDVNQIAQSQLGYEHNELLGRSFNDLVDLGSQYPAWQEYIEGIKSKKQLTLEGQLKCKDGSTLPVEMNIKYVAVGRKDYLLATARDITERKIAAERIHLLSYYDSLTGLPNSNLFKEILDRTIRYANRYQKKFAVVFIDLDDFKRINDSLGHDSGDRLLRIVSRRLISTIRSSDDPARVSGEKVQDIARPGGDEFMVLLNEIGSVQNLGHVARRILDALSQPYTLEGHELFITASMGIAMFPHDGSDVGSIFKNADTALHQAKTKGKNNYQFYSKTMNYAALEMLTMESELHKAIDHNELQVFYQPQLDLRTRRITGMEALIRWWHPDMGWIPPAKFIPLAEANGDIMQIGKFVLNTACLQIKKWREIGLNPPGVAVNLSSRQFDQADLLSQIERALQAARLDHGNLELEITEGTVMKNPAEAVLTLNRLKAAGVRIAIDDFGIGYSSLNYLKRLPIDVLKIDISFIRSVVTSPNDAAIVKTIIAMAHNLNLEVIAEGVENERQLAFLQENGCDAMQGFWLSPAVPADQFAKLIAQRAA